MDFKGALNAGLLAAKKARSNKEEIISVIKELSWSIQEFTEGKISLEITSEKELSENHNAFTSVISSLASVTPYREYKALSLIRRIEKNIRKKIIAEWRLNDSDGYPCVISYNKQSVRCSTKDALAQALNDLISDARSGEAILELMEVKNAD